jgi:hypothetical protein
MKRHRIAEIIAQIRKEKLYEERERKLEEERLKKAAEGDGAEPATENEEKAKEEEVKKEEEYKYTEVQRGQFVDKVRVLVAKWLFLLYLFMIFLFFK